MPKIPAAIAAGIAYVSGGRSLQRGLIGCFNDLDELFGNQGGTADQAAVDIGLGQQLVSVLLVHAAAVQDGDCPGVLGAVELADDGADALTDFLCLLRRGGLASADGPDGFVGNDNLADFFLRYSL